MLAARIDQSVVYRNLALSCSELAVCHEEVVEASFCNDERYVVHDFVICIALFYLKIRSGIRGVDRARNVDNHSSFVRISLDHVLDIKSTRVRN